MKIKLISPRMTLRPMDSEYKRVLSPSISLLVIAALTPPEHEVTIADENVEKLKLNDNPDLVAITVNVDTCRGAYAIAKHYRDKNVPVVMGGIHASAAPDEALQYADAVCIGEAENVWPGIISDVQSNNLKRKYFSREPADLEMTPFPRWDLLKTSNYLYTNIVCASRGCPFSCEFCYNSCQYIHNCYRNRPVDHVIEEISRLGTRHVMFIDDNFFGNTTWLKEFITRAKPLKITWHAAVSANIGSHPDLLDEMRESGCRSLFIGLESINERSIKNAGKHQNKIDQYENLIRNLHERGIMLNASMVYGFDGDYPNVFDNTLQWLVANKVETMTGHILTPYPGTKFYKKLLKENRIIDFDYSHYNTSHVVFKPKNMTPEELYKGYLDIYHRFYSVKNILSRLPDDFKNRMSFLLFNFGYRKFGKLTSKVASVGLMNSLGKLARRLSYGIA